MFAVIRTGGKQYKVAADDRITVMTIEGDVGAAITFDEVLSLVDGESVEIGAPLLAGASVAAEIVEQTRGPKVIAFKKRRRQNSKRKRGHRQDLTVVRIVELLKAGQEPTRQGAGEAAVERSDADVPPTHAPEALAEAGAA